jgi:hypothetical protein
MLKRITFALLSIASLIACDNADNNPNIDKPINDSIPIAKDVVSNSPEAVAIASLNKQIDDFNSSREPNRGISPISQRVYKVYYDSAKDKITCSGQDGNSFLVLKREPDGRFKGTISIIFHELAFSRPDGSHKRGEIIADFYLNNNAF